MRIYLVGYMGCGKTTLGRKLAHHAGLQFIDLDHFIENRYCKSVPIIFAEEGEETFRLKEKKALAEVSEFSDVVIATGGGAPCFFNNMELMNQTGKTLYLNINPEILADRLFKSKNERPLIKGKSKEELTKFIAETLNYRSQFYEQAQYQITEPDMEPEQIMKMIKEI